MLRKNWFWDQGYYSEQLRMAGSTAEASIMHRDFVHRLQDADRWERLELLADYNAGREAFRKEVS